MGAILLVLANWSWCSILRRVLFQIDAEKTHNWTMKRFSSLMRVPGLQRVTTALFRVNDPRLCIRRFGLEFPNPVGLSAGLDKDAKWCRSLAALGFGFIEVGTLTAQSQSGRAKPRVFRLPADNALLNRMGSPNDGAAAAVKTLIRCPPRTTLGINIGKTANVPNEEAPRDYLESFEALYPFANYFALNVSSPNTPGLRKLQAVESLGEILRTLIGRNADLAAARKESPKPILVKVSPDLEEEQLGELVDLCVDLHLDGIIVANTTTSRAGLKTPTGAVQAKGEGGVSGRPLTQRARSLVAAVYRRTRGALPIIGVGGIMSEEDAWQMIRAGASLVQVYTGLIYHGPTFVADINRHLLRRLAERGAASIEEVVGEASRLPEDGRVGAGASLPKPS